MATERPRTARDLLQELAGVLRQRYECHAQLVGTAGEPSVAVAHGGGSARVTCQTVDGGGAFWWPGHETVRGVDAAAEAIVRSLRPARRVAARALAQDSATVRLPSHGASMDQ